MKKWSSKKPFQHISNRCTDYLDKTNPITMLPNLSEFIEDIEPVLRKQNIQGTILYIRVNELQKINHTLGFRAENKFVEHFAVYLKKRIHPEEKLYHLDGNTFILTQEDPCFCPNDCFERLRKLTEVPFVHNHQPYHYTVSAVACQYPGQIRSLKALLRECEVALAKLPAKGENTFVVYNETMNNEYYEKIQLENTLRNSVQNNMDGFYIHYQPLVSADSHHCVGAEVLLRWKHPNGKSFSPSIFIPMLEDLSLICTVGEWVIKKAAKQCKSWTNNQFSDDFYVSINISPLQLSESSFAAKVLSILSKAKLSTKNITMEITENHLVNYKEDDSQLVKLRDAGIKISIDDFGVGYSSLNYIKSIPSDEIKIDKSFIQNIDTDSCMSLLVNSIIRISHKANKRICVEGVETAAQVKTLKNMQADLLQGFLFSHPVDEKVFEGLYSKS